TPEAMALTRWTDWAQSAQDALTALRRDSREVFVAGQSLGGTLALHLAALNPDVKGVIAIGGMGSPAYFRDWRIKVIRGLKYVMRWHVPADDCDLGDPTALQLLHSYARRPTVCIESLLQLLRVVDRELPTISVPALVVHGRNDRTLDVANAPHIMERIGSAKAKTVTAINGGGAARLAFRLEQFAGGITESGWREAPVPGIVDAWRVALERHGTMAPAALFEDAIRYPEQGFPITARLARNLREFMQIAAAYPATMAVFFPDGRPPDEGSVLRQGDLARTLRSLAERLDDFYRGPIAAAISEASARGGGLFSTGDFAAHRTDVLQPISTTYRG